MRHRRDSSGSLVPKAVPGGKKEAALREHSSCSQVKGDKNTNVRKPRPSREFRAKGYDLRGCADSAGVSDSLTAGEARTHNPLVPGWNILIY
jgi:hypothetical protein